MDDESVNSNQLTAVLVLSLFSFVWSIIGFYDWFKTLIRPDDSFQQTDRRIVTVTNEKVSEALPLIHRLHELHDKKTENGSPSWYVRPELYRQVDRLENDFQQIKFALSDASHSRRSSAPTSGEEEEE